VHKIELDGRLMAYHDRGTGDPVLLLHPGFVADGMLPLLDQPALQPFRLIASHRRGYGSSAAAQPPVSMVDLAADVVGLLDAQGIERAHLVGHSLGGCVALEVARAHPARIGRVALLEPPLGFFLSEASLGLLMGVAGEAMRHFVVGEHEQAVGVWLDGAFGPGWQAQLERTLPGGVAQATRDAPAAFAIEVPALQAWPFGPSDLAAIGAPMLSAIHADPWAGFVDVHEALLAAGADSAFIPVPSHLLQIINPDAVATVIAAFLGA
jgi:pimeloyl-ACP methyl ester carboxylesterase